MTTRISTMDSARPAFCLETEVASPVLPGNADQDGPKPYNSQGSGVTRPALRPRVGEADAGAIEKPGDRFRSPGIGIRGDDMRFVTVFVMVLALGGCGLVALPCKLTRDLAEVIPGVGGVIAAPFDACAKAID